EILRNVSSSALIRNHQTRVPLGPSVNQFPRQYRAIGRSMPDLVQVCRTIIMPIFQESAKFRTEVTSIRGTDHFRFTPHYSSLRGRLLLLTRGTLLNWLTNSLM